MNLDEINNKLKELAYERTTPFCYTCYKKCPKGICNECGSDDLMLHLNGVGVEYGTDWVIESILEEEVEEANIDEIFEQMIEDAYGETIRIGFIESSTVVAIRSVDPTAWEIAKNEYLCSLIEDEQIIEFGLKVYNSFDILKIL